MIRKKTFSGGVHPHETGGGKMVTAAMPVKTARAPATVAILLSQNVGAPAKPLCKAGDRVLMGQKIAEPAGFVGAPLHASVSGKVKGIQTRYSAAGAAVQAIVIENDGLDEWCPSVKPPENPDSLDRQALTGLIREAGIVGLGGAAFPTAVKLSPPPDKQIDALILNGAECEPYLTSDHRTMLEHADEIVDGLLFAKKILDAKAAYIGIEENKPDALAAMERASAGKDITVCALPVKYPQGGEKQLIQVVTGRQVPSGKLPMDAGAVVMNVSTAAAVSLALRKGIPLIERTVTVTGLVASPANLRVRIGETIGSLIEQCGGMSPGVNKVIMGGPMMGMSVWNMDTPVVKGTVGLLLLNDQTRPDAPISNCIRCASCVGVCPIHLMPLSLYALSRHGRYEEGKKQHALDCIECGSCSYICPAKLPLVQTIRVLKREIQKMSRKNG